MSDLTYASGLTAYNKDGLELFIHKDGKAYASQSAMARMINDSNDSKVRRFLDRRFSHVAPLQVLTNKGGKRSSLYGVEVIVALVAEYNPELSIKFMEMGANVYLYQLAGYKVGVSVTSTSGKPSELEQAEYMQKLMNDNVERLRYLLDKPGLANKMADAHNGPGSTLEAAELDFNELCEQEGYTNLTAGEKCKYSAKLAISVVNDILRPLNKKTVSYKNTHGKTIQRKVNTYPASSGVTLRNVMG